MFIAVCKDGNTVPARLKKFGRAKRIYCDHNGRFYFNRYYMRDYLDDIMRLPYPWFYYDPEGKLGVVSGYEYIGCGKCLYVEILDDGESVQLWEKV